MYRLYSVYKLRRLKIHCEGNNRESNNRESVAETETVLFYFQCGIDEENFDSNKEKFGSGSLRQRVVRGK